MSAWLRDKFVTYLFSNHTISEPWPLAALDSPSTNDMQLNGCGSDTSDCSRPAAGRQRGTDNPDDSRTAAGQRRDSSRIEAGRQQYIGGTAAGQEQDGGEDDGGVTAAGRDVDGGTGAGGWGGRDPRQRSHDDDYDNGEEGCCLGDGGDSWDCR